jgi:hypothetical protein
VQSKFDTIPFWSAAPFASWLIVFGITRNMYIATGTAIGSGFVSIWQIARLRLNAQANAHDTR